MSDMLQDDQLVYKVWGYTRVSSTGNTRSLDLSLMLCAQGQAATEKAICNVAGAGRENDWLESLQAGTRARQDFDVLSKRLRLAHCLPPEHMKGEKRSIRFSDKWCNGQHGD